MGINDIVRILNHHVHNCCTESYTVALKDITFRSGYQHLKSEVEREIGEQVVGQQVRSRRAPQTSVADPTADMGFLQSLGGSGCERGCGVVLTAVAAAQLVGC